MICLSCVDWPAFFQLRFYIKICLLCFLRLARNGGSRCRKLAGCAVCRVLCTVSHFTMTASLRWTHSPCLWPNQVFFSCSTHGFQCEAASKSRRFAGLLSIHCCHEKLERDKPLSRHLLSFSFHHHQTLSLQQLINHRAFIYYCI